MPRDRHLLAAAVARRPGTEGCFELSIGNADKGTLPLAEVRRRVDQFVAAGLPVLVTQVRSWAVECMLASPHEHRLPFAARKCEMM